MKKDALEQEWKHFSEKTEEEIEREAEEAWREHVNQTIIKFSIITLICLFFFHDILLFWVKFGIPYKAPQKAETVVTFNIDNDIPWERIKLENENPAFEVYKTLEQNEPVFIKKKAKFSITANLAAKNYLFWGNYMPGGKRIFQSTALIDLGLTWGKLSKPNVSDLYFFYCTKDTIGRSFLTKLKWTTKILPLPWLYVEDHMLMVHSVPANKNVMHGLLLARKNKPVKIDGYLIDIKDDNDKILYAELPKRSLSKGLGKSKTVLIEQVQIGNKIYR